MNEKSVIAMLVPERSNDLQEMRSKDGQLLQVTYMLQIEFPRLGIRDDGAQFLKSEGWTRCAGGVSGWQEHLESNGTQRVWDQLQYWKKTDRLLIISMRYVTAIERGASAHENAPKPGSQKVVLILSREGTELGEKLLALGVSCS